MTDYVKPLSEPWQLALPENEAGDQYLGFPAGFGPLLACSSKPRISKFRGHLPLHGPSFPNGQGVVLRLHDLPASERDKSETWSVSTGKRAVEQEITLVEQVRKPKKRKKKKLCHQEEDSKSEEMMEFVDVAVGIMNELRLGAEYVAGKPHIKGDSSLAFLNRHPEEFRKGPLHVARLSWKDVAGLITRSDEEPRLDIIVRIAQDFSADLNKLVNSPRRMLRRERVRTALARVQQLDSGCLTWLVRQAGRTAVQKAGSSQQILSVIRKENYNTLENRVLKDFIRRCIVSADLYLRQSRNFQRSMRYRLVSAFRIQCMRLYEIPYFEDISGLQQIPLPNYVLQYDRAYNKLWTWYLKLVKREEANDEAWRWQRRLWADVARLCLAVALVDLRAPGHETSSFFDQSVWIRNEQEFGSWFVHVDWPGPIIMEDSQGRRAVAHCLHPLNMVPDQDYLGMKLAALCGPLGADMLIVFSPVDDEGKERCKPVCLFVWAIHSASETTSDKRVQQQTENARKAILSVCRDISHRVGLYGLVMRSKIGEGIQDLKPSRGGKVLVEGLCVPGNPDEWRGELMDHLRQYLCECFMGCWDGI